MKYLLLMCADPTVQPDSVDDIEVWLNEVGSRRLDGDRLQPVSDATSVRVRGGETLVTDGPFAETREHIGGYDVIECANLDEALEIAAKHPVAKFGTVEVRPFWVW